ELLGRQVVDHALEAKTYYANPYFAHISCFFCSFSVSSAIRKICRSKGSTWSGGSCSNRARRYVPGPLRKLHEARLSQFSQAENVGIVTGSPRNAVLVWFSLRYGVVTGSGYR